MFFYLFIYLFIFSGEDNLPKLRRRHSADESWLGEEAKLLELEDEDEDDNKEYEREKFTNITE